MRKLFLNILLIIMVGIFLFSSYKIIDYVIDSKKSEDIYIGLKEQVKNEDQNSFELNEELTFEEKYQSLIEKNDDFYGWIKIEGTNIDYPLMYTPDDEDFYLRKNFEKEYSAGGVPFIGTNTDLEHNNNIIVYGHNMHNGTMFAPVIGYFDKEFYDNHKYIEIETYQGKDIYEIFAIFKTVPVLGKDSYVDYYNFSWLDNEKSFNDQISLYKRMSLYDTGVEVSYGDKLLTISTCEYSQKNGRLVIVAKK